MGVKYYCYDIDCVKLCDPNVENYLQNCEKGGQVKFLSRPGVLY